MRTVPDGGCCGSYSGHQSGHYKPRIMQNRWELMHAHLYYCCSILLIVKPEPQVCGSECGLDPAEDIGKMFRGISPVTLCPGTCQTDVN